MIAVMKEALQCCTVLGYIRDERLSYYEGYFDLHVICCPSGPQVVGGAYCYCNLYCY